MGAAAIRLTDLGICCALGYDKSSVMSHALACDVSGMHRAGDILVDGGETVVGRVRAELPGIDQYPAYYRSRNNQIALQCLGQIEEAVERSIRAYGKRRVAVVVGTSTSGIAEGEQALREHARSGHLPGWYDYRMQEMGSVCDFVQHAAGVGGPALAISTACSSSSQALLTGRDLINSGMADAVICGGVDSLCGLTVNGFHALESLSDRHCLPFSRNRRGINIGEGGALFLMERGAGGVSVLGGGSASDAYHMSAPHPEGRGAYGAIRQALDEAQLDGERLGYANLHGTATPLNDAMESRVMNLLGLDQVPASSTKALTGHTLGAAGAIEAGLCWLMLSEYNEQKRVIPHCWDQAVDAQLPPMRLAVTEDALAQSRCLSNSFAFGGSNVAIVLGWEEA